MLWNKLTLHRSKDGQHYDFASYNIVPSLQQHKISTHTIEYKLAKTFHIISLKLSNLKSMIVCCIKMLLISELAQIKAHVAVIWMTKVTYKNILTHLINGGTCGFKVGAKASHIVIITTQCIT